MSAQLNTRQNKSCPEDFTLLNYRAVCLADKMCATLSNRRGLSLKINVDVHDERVVTFNRDVPDTISNNASRDRQSVPASAKPEHSHVNNPDKADPSSRCNLSTPMPGTSTGGGVVMPQGSFAEVVTNTKPSVTSSFNAFDHLFGNNRASQATLKEHKILKQDPSKSKNKISGYFLPSTESLTDLSEIAENGDSTLTLTSSNVNVGNSVSTTSMR